MCIAPVILRETPRVARLISGNSDKRLITSRIFANKAWHCGRRIWIMRLNLIFWGGNKRRSQRIKFYDFVLPGHAPSNFLIGFPIYGIASSGPLILSLYLSCLPSSWTVQCQYSFTLDVGLFCTVFVSRINYSDSFQGMNIS